MPPFDSPRLIADIGGTYARFAIETSHGVFEHKALLRCADHDGFHAAVAAYLKSPPVPAIHHAAVAIPNPVEGDRVRMTRHPWQFSIEQMRERLGLDTLVVVNDFSALAMALPRLACGEVRQIGGGTARQRSVMGLLGSGSGLGVSALVPTDSGWLSLGSEGGHASVSPRDEREIAILRHASQQFSHVSFERLLSGPGLELMRRALLARAGLAGEDLAAPEITRRALSGGDPVCAETLDVFCALLGTAAANLAVTLGALGGIYIGGSIVPRLGDSFDRSLFRARFEDKGRLSDYLAAIPTFVITSENATFIGASAILEAQLSALRATAGSAILGQIRRTRRSLSPAELRVADHVLVHPRSVLNAPIAAIAREAGVSQPTVIRFCRSLGCQGLSDFKLRLASGLSGSIPITHSQVNSGDTMLELGAKVLDNTASAALALRDQLNQEVIDAAVGLLAGAERIELFAVGHYGVVAQDAQFKFLRLGVPSAAHVEPNLQRFAADLLRPRDVAVVISNSGRIPELIAVVDKAHERGAKVVAITAHSSPLARKADLALNVDPVENPATHLPMISRILHLLVIDILAVGVALRRSDASAIALVGRAEASLDEAAAAPAAAPRARRAAAARSRGGAAGLLAGITSHGR